MQITYIPPTLASPSKGIIQSAVENALTNTIIVPLKNWCYEVTTKGLVLAEWGLMFGCAWGIIFWICGVEKGKKTAIVCALVYIGLQIVKVVFM